MSTQSISSGANTLGLSETNPSLRGWLIGTVREWRRRFTSRRELAAMSYCELKDLGFPAAAAAGIEKRFWQP